MVKTAEVMTISLVQSKAKGFGTIKKHYQIIQDQSIDKGYRMVIGNRIFINPEDYVEAKKFYLASSTAKFINSLTEIMSGRPSVAPNIFKKRRD